MKLGGATRQMAIWTAVVAAAAVGSGTAIAAKSNPERSGPDRRHGRGAPALTVEGRAVSRGDNEVWAMAVRGHSEKDPSDAGGVVRFGHRGPNGSDGLTGQIKCLSVDSAGVVQLSGTVERSATRQPRNGGNAPKPGVQPPADDEGGQLLDDILGVDPQADTPAESRPGDGRDGPRRGRGELAGKDFAFTIDVAGNPQRFSVPRLGDAGTLSACSAGGETVPVTRGGFRSTETQGR
jgi:hypothetical protein